MIHDYIYMTFILFYMTVCEILINPNVPALRCVECVLCRKSFRIKVGFSAWTRGYYLWFRQMCSFCFCIVLLRCLMFEVICFCLPYCFWQSFTWINLYIPSIHVFVFNHNSKSKANQTIDFLITMKINLKWATK